MTRAAGKKQAKLMNKFTSPTGEVSQATQDKLIAKVMRKQARAKAKLATCTGLQARLESMGGKQVWSPAKLGKRHVATDASNELLRWGKLLVAIIPGEEDIWQSFYLVVNDQLFAACRHRAFYLPSALWYEFPCQNEKKEKKLDAAFETLHAEIDGLR